MKHLTHKPVLTFTFIILIVIAGLCSGAYQWQKIHYRKPIAAFYTLASAMEHGNRAELGRLAQPGVSAELYKLAKPYGGIQQLGRLLRKSPKVSAFIHVPLTSIEVVAKVKGRRLLILFARRGDNYIATTTFYAD